jgi:hypothetical protein
MSVSPIPVSMQAVPPITTPDMSLFGTGVSKGNTIGASPSLQNKPNAPADLNTRSTSFLQMFSSTVESSAQTLPYQSELANDSGGSDLTGNSDQSGTESKLSRLNDLRPFLTAGKNICPPNTWQALPASKHDKGNSDGMTAESSPGGGLQQQPLDLSGGFTLPLFVWAQGVRVTMPIAVSADPSGTEGSPTISSNSVAAGVPVPVSGGLAVNQTSDPAPASLDQGVQGGDALAFEIRLSQPGNQGPYGAISGAQSTTQLEVTKDSPGGEVVGNGNNSAKPGAGPDPGSASGPSTGTRLQAAGNPEPAKDPIPAPPKREPVGPGPGSAAMPAAASIQAAKAPAGIGVPFLNNQQPSGDHKPVSLADESQNTVSVSSAKPRPAAQSAIEPDIPAAGASGGGQHNPAHDPQASASHGVTGNEGDPSSAFNVPAPTKGNKPGSGQEIFQTPLGNPFGIHPTADGPAAASESKVSSNPPGLPTDNHVSSSQPTSKPDLSVNMTGQSGETVNVRVSERGGEIQIAVRASDTAISSQIKHELPAVQAALERIGWHSEATSGAAQASAHHGDSQSESESGHQQGWRNNSDGQSRQDRRRSSGQDPWASLLGQDL